MKKEIFEGLCSIVNEMTNIRQKAQEELVSRSKDYRIQPSDLVHLRLQMKSNMDKISYYSRIKHELRVVYEKYKNSDIKGEL